MRRGKHWCRGEMKKATPVIESKEQGAYQAGEDVGAWVDHQQIVSYCKRGVGSARPRGSRGTTTQTQMKTNREKREEWRGNLPISRISQKGDRVVQIVTFAGDWRLGEWQGAHPIESGLKRQHNWHSANYNSVCRREEWLGRIRLRELKSDKIHAPTKEKIVERLLGWKPQRGRAHLGL